MHDHGAAEFSGTGGIGVLVVVGGLGKWHQDRWCSAHGQLADAAGPRTTDGQIGLLQQSGNLFAEGAFHQHGVPKCSRFRIIPAGEMHHAATLSEQIRQHGAHHPVHPYSTLASPDHHQQGAFSSRNPVGCWLRLKKGRSHRCASDQGLAAGDPFRSSRQTDSHGVTEPTQ